MTELPFIERIRRIRQNQHAGLDYQLGTNEQRAEHLRKMQVHQDAFEKQHFGKDH